LRPESLIKPINNLNNLNIKTINKLIKKPPTRFDIKKLNVEGQNCKKKQKKNPVKLD
jgi:hypothetical protein